jgi:ATP-dependent exoDNAse (exonuclease V) beta subunit
MAKKKSSPAPSENPLPALLVRASAGTGKTYALAGRLLSILLSGASPDSLLATTFTRKAAAEILNRIFETLAAAAQDPQHLSNLRNQTGIATTTASECRMLLHRLVRDIHRLRICTLDSLFSQFARAFPLELRLPSGWRLSDEVEEVWIRRRSLEKMLAAIEPKELNSILSMLGKGDAIRSIDNEFQSIIVDAYQESRWCDAEAWNTLPSVSMPADESIREAIHSLENASIGHASADEQLRKIAVAINTNDWESLLGKKIVSEAALLPNPGSELRYYRKLVPTPIVTALQVVFRGSKANLLGLLAKQSFATGKVLQLYAQYHDLLKNQLRLLAFDDVAFRLAKWISSIAPQELAERMDGSLNHVLLDEFQDTSPAQWMVLRPLAQHATSDPPKTSFFCVGDTKQAIYGWRGGKAEIFDAVAEELSGVQQASQDLSYRSSPVISQFVTQLFQSIDSHPQYPLPQGPPQSKDDFEATAIHYFARNFPVHASARDEQPGYVCLRTGASNESSPDSSDDVKLQNLSDTAQYIAALAQNTPDRSIGVLTRTNRSVALLIFLLKRLQVDVSQEGGNPLIDSALVELVLSALSLAEHPGDQRWAYHVAHSPLADPLGLPPFSNPKDKEERMANIDQAANRIRDSLEHLGLAQTVIWLSKQLLPIAASSDAQRLRQLISLALQYQQNPQPRLASFVELVRLKRVERPRPAQVRVMTIHQAKGLEFDTVVLPELNGTLTRMSRKIIAKHPHPMQPPDGLLRYVGNDCWPLLPPQWQQAFGANAAAMMTEALCLLYVAVTRPRHALHMLVPCVKKTSLDARTPAGLIYHGLGCSTPANEPHTILFESGSSDWWRKNLR